MPNIPSAVPSVIKLRKELPIHEIGEPMKTNINDLIPNVKYSYKKITNNGTVRNYEGIYIKQQPDINNKNHPIYFFDEVHYVDNNGKLYLGNHHYPLGQYPVDFVEIPITGQICIPAINQNPVSKIRPVIGTKYVGPVLRPPLPLGGGKIRKSKNRKTKNYRRRGTRKH